MPVVTERDFSALAAQHVLGDDAVPDVVLALAGDVVTSLVWRNELGGMTFRFSNRFVKWNPRSTGIDLHREQVRLAWIEGRHPAPRVVAFGDDDDAQWLVTEALPGESAVGDRWRARRQHAIAAIATGLRAMHSIPLDDFPDHWSREVWVSQRPASLGPPPKLDTPVIVHGDACAPNTLISNDGQWTGNVDFGDLAISDRWADLAIASLSLDWNFGEGHQDELFSAYGIERDEERIAYYRALWHLEA